MSPSAPASNCIFCKIINKEIPSTVIDEDGDFIAFRDVNPQAPTHALVIPKEHIANISEAKDATLLGKLFRKACDIAQNDKLDGGFRLVVNTGDDGGQTVHHLHVHVLGGRRLSWPPG